MKNFNKMTVLILMIFVFIAGIAYAASAGEKGADKTTEKTTIKDVKKEMAEALEIINAYSADQRDEAVKSVETTLADIDSKIEDYENRIENKWDQMDQATRNKTKNTLKLLQKKRNEVAEWYGGMKHSSDMAWDHIKKGFTESYQSLSDAYDKAMKEF